MRRPGLLASTLDPYGYDLPDQSGYSPLPELYTYQVGAPPVYQVPYQHPEHYRPVHDYYYQRAGPQPIKSARRGRAPSVRSKIPTVSSVSAAHCPNTIHTLPTVDLNVILHELEIIAKCVAALTSAITSYKEDKLTKQTGLPQSAQSAD